MVTFAQAQERAEEWINGELPAYQHREVRVREFDLGFVVWAEDRAEGPRSDGGAQRLVIARDSGEATLWPALPVGEVIRRYEEEYGRPEEAPEPAPAPAARVDLNQTSFLLSPPEWLQEAADKLGIPDRRGSGTPPGRVPVAVRVPARTPAWPRPGPGRCRGRRPGFPRRLPLPRLLPLLPLPPHRPTRRAAGRVGRPPGRVVPGVPARVRAGPVRLPGRRPGRGRTPTPMPARTVPYRCPRRCSRRR